MARDAVRIQEQLHIDVFDEAGVPERRDRDDGFWAMGRRVSPYRGSRRLDLYHAARGVRQTPTTLGAKVFDVPHG